MRKLRLSAVAENDIANILARTAGDFGETARQRYETLLVTALQDIARDPESIGSFARPEIGPAVRTYHLRHSRERARVSHGVVRKPRHLVLYRVLRADIVEVGRVLYDAMDIGQQIPADFGEDG
jgi:toxin ParE1/3/4